MRAVRFDRFGGPDVLEVREVDAPELTVKRAIVRVRATGINPGEIAIREGRLESMFPTQLPCGQGSDLAGEVVETVPGAPFNPGDAVLGWTDERRAQAELVSVPIAQLLHKPDELSWEVAGSLYVAGLAGRACVRAVGASKGDTVVVAGAAGGVGLVAAQLARAAGATVIGLASPANHDWLRSRDLVPVAYGEGQEVAIREAAAGPVDAFIDAFGAGYVELALRLGVAPDRVNTVIDFEGAGRHPGVHTDGTQADATANALAEVVEAILGGALEVPIAATYPLAEVRGAYEELAKRHTRGKIVLIP